MWNSSDYVVSIRLFQISGQEVFLPKLGLLDVGSSFQSFPARTSVWCAVLTWIAAEIVFAMFIYYLVLPRLHQMKEPTQYHGDIFQMMKKTLDQVKNLESYTFKMYIQGFCNNAKFEDIYIDNFRSFLSWCMFHKHLESLSNSERSTLAEVLAYASEVHPEVFELKPGFNPKVSHCRMTLEPLPMIHRPLLLYALVNWLEWLSNCILLHACGFQRLEINGMGYWYKQPDQTKALDQGKEARGKEPLVILHGISTGWMVYMTMVRALARGRALLLIDVDAIKVKSLNFDMPTPQQFVDRVVRILDRHKIAKASFVGHSFGSVTAGWFVRHHPERVSHLTLIDPVSLLLGFPNVAYSFLYRKPSSLVEWVIYLGAGQEVTVSYALRRHFFWYNNTLWLEDIPDHIGVVVGVSSNDEIIDAAAVHEYVNNCRQRRLIDQAQARRRRQRRLQETQKTQETQVAASSPSHRVTRSMTIHPSSIQIQERHGDTSPTVYANIESVKWERFSHGQILIPTNQQQQFISLIHNNELSIKNSGDV